MADQLKLVLPACLCLAAVGCGGGKMGTVEGKVTLDGQPLKGAMVQFQPTDGRRPSAAVTDEEGYYELRYTTKQDGAVIGKHRVQISTYGENEDEQGNPVIVPERVPAKYNVNTTLVREVESGSNTFDFKLDSQGQKVQPGADGGRPPALDTCGGWEEDEF
jgi:hypothetical protein